MVEAQPGSKVLVAGCRVVLPKTPISGRERKNASGFATLERLSAWKLAFWQAEPPVRGRHWFDRQGKRQTGTEQPVDDAHNFGNNKWLPLALASGFGLLPQTPVGITLTTGTFRIIAPRYLPRIHVAG